LQRDCSERCSLCSGAGWSSESISRRLCAIGRHAERCPPGLDLFPIQYQDFDEGPGVYVYVSLRGCLLIARLLMCVVVLRRVADLVEHRVFGATVNAQDIVKAVGQHLISHGSTLRFGVDEYPAGLVVRIFPKASASHAEPEAAPTTLCGSPPEHVRLAVDEYVGRAQILCAERDIEALDERALVRFASL
jgi:hypothetical protein